MSYRDLDASPILPGTYSGKSGDVLDGVFQFIKEADGMINHRLFVPGGR